MNVRYMGHDGNVLASSRFFFSCKARFFAGLFFGVFFFFFTGENTRLKQLQPA